jgi:hypothetical protein
METAMNPTPKPAALVGRMGSHLAISLGIALAIAAAISLPRSFGSGGQSGAARMVQWPVAVAAASQGKFIDRLSLAAGQERPGGHAFTPAVLAMPMVAVWPEPDARPAPAQSAAAPPKLKIAAASLTPLPPRRDQDLTDGKSALAPPPLLPAVVVPRPGESPAGNGGWTRIVTAPATKVADMVIGTAGMAQAAGSWTLSQASGLLPRW